MAEQTFDDCVRKCPYCGHTHQPESETYSEDVRDEECEECGKTYSIHDSFTVTHYATPDCELNDEAHEWIDRTVRGGRMHPFCSKCDKCMPMSLVAQRQMDIRRRPARCRSNAPPVEIALSPFCSSSLDAESLPLGGRRAHWIA